MNEQSPHNVPDFNLTAPSAAIGRVFDEIGASLAACDDGIGLIMTDAKRIGAELRGDTLEGNISKIEPILDHCRGLLSEFEQEAAFLFDLEKSITATRDPLVDLGRTIKMVQMVSVNARVVSASIDTTEDLGAFTNDLGVLVADMNGVTGRFTAISEELVRSLRAERTELGHFRSVQGERLRSAVSTLPHDLSRINRLEMEAGKMQRSLESGAEEMQRSVSRAVPLLQVGDATRQRLEHVTDMPNLVDSALRDAAIVADLRGELLAAAVAQLHEDNRHIGDELDHIGASIAQIVQQAASSNGQNDRNDLVAIKSAIEDTITLLGECGQSRMLSASLRDTSHASLDHLSSCLGELDDIARAAGWVSMNAAISCLRLGDEGIPLTLVAEQVRDLNSEVTRHTSRIVSLITDGKAKFAQVDKGRPDQETEFAEFREHFTCTLERVDEAYGQVDRLRSRLRDTAAEIDGQLQSVHKNCKSLQAIVEELVIRAARVRPKPGDDQALSRDEFQAARAALTMQSERAIFDAVLAEWLPPEDCDAEFGTEVLVA